MADGAVFIGSNTGWFYQLSETTGAVLHKAFIGRQPRKTCSSIGIADTATVAVDPKDHQDTVYVGGPNGYLYAFGASDLSLKWKSVIAIPSARTSNYFQWSSPTVANGKIYIGVSSHCDIPLIRGGVIGYKQASGKKFAEFRTVPTGDIGGSVWSSVAVARDGDVYATTGNGPAAVPRLRYSESIVKLAPGTLRPLGYFKVPVSQVTFDGDFGASPTIFGRYVGACDKNGIFYAVKRSTMTLARERRIGAGSSATTYAQCSAAAAYNGKHLYFGGTAVTIHGKSHRARSRSETRPPAGCGGRPACPTASSAAQQWMAAGHRRRDLRLVQDSQRGLPPQCPHREDRPNPHQGQQRFRPERLRRRQAVHGQRHRRVRLGVLAFAVGLDYRTRAGFPLHSCGEDICLTDGSPRPTMVVAAGLPAGGVTC